MAPSDAIVTAPLLTVADIETGYGKKRVLDAVSLTVGHGEAVTILGHNGAGKTTILRAIFGLQPLWKGRIVLDGTELAGMHNAREAVARGMAMIPSERFVFPDLTVLENLRIGTRGMPTATRDERLEAAYRDYPILKERSTQPAGAMSGGEQRMVSLAMALMRRPRLLLLDEPSLGLSPAVVEQVMERVRGLVASGMSVILVEQNVPAALSVATRIYVLRSGQMLLEESTIDFAVRGRENWWSLF